MTTSPCQQEGYDIQFPRELSTHFVISVGCSFHTHFDGFLKTVKSSQESSKEYSQIRGQRAEIGTSLSIKARTSRAFRVSAVSIILLKVGSVLDLVHRIRIYGPSFRGVISPQGPKIDPSFSLSVGETVVSSLKDQRYNVLVGFSQLSRLLLVLCDLQGFSGSVRVSDRWSVFGGQVRSVPSLQTCKCAKSL